MKCTPFLILKNVGDEVCKKCKKCNFNGILVDEVARNAILMAYWLMKLQEM
jgi:hypothetical protein